MAGWLDQLSRVFEEDSLIDEYALVPEVSHALFGIVDAEGGDMGCMAAEHKLALSVEAALLLYLHASQQLQKSCDAAAMAAAATRAILLCSADCTGAWLRRWDMVLNKALDVESELHFGAMLLRTNHKSGETWAWRRCLLASCLQVLPSEEASARVEYELLLVEELAKRYDHHYYAWNHWAWLDRFCRGRSGVIVAGETFPRLAHATPSHYGIFHHRIMRLRQQLEQMVLCSKATEGLAMMEGQHTLDLPEAAHDLYSAERRLSDALISTYPYLEAPWHFRLQLFAVGLEATGAVAHPSSPSPQAVSRVLDLWKSEFAFAKAQADGVPEMSQNTQTRLARRFRVHALQELTIHLHAWQGGFSHCEAPDATVGWREQLMQELDQLQAYTAAAPALLFWLRHDLDSLTAAGCG